ncbi:hypothetical protein PLANPX_2505 [Lacipirellula parvula]|uniref:Uncharacterized protein n=1 Tax=Lacipirellula parvula TaxID=2650471 RepID=A0A5K7XF77_9BACT|nr:hypothetical protein PLANPX_2505 [Lacipirellula parvula]
MSSGQIETARGVGGPFTDHRRPPVNPKCKAMKRLASRLASQCGSAGKSRSLRLRAFA